MEYDSVRFLVRFLPSAFFLAGVFLGGILGVGFGGDKVC
jgi:hypothetical protein